MTDIEKPKEKADIDPKIEEDDDMEDVQDADRYASAIVPETDDPTLPALTFRVILLGSMWCVLLAGANAIMHFRTNPFSLDYMLATLLSYPVGVLLARVLPDWSIRLPFISFSLNPGPFSVKEHVLISIMASAGAAGAYGIDNVVVQRSEMYIGNTKIGFAESLAWVFASQFIGYGIAGISRRFLVKPKAMLWPGILSSVALFVTLHQPDVPSGKWTMSRYKFFWVVFAAIFVYTWIPEYLMVALQGIALLCLASNNRIVRFLGSGKSGVGILNVTLDWYYIGGSVLTIPFVYYLNKVVGMVLYNWIAAPLLHLNNAFGAPEFKLTQFPDGQYMHHINNVKLYNASGHPIAANRLYDKKTFDLDKEVYAANAPIYITELFALNYLANFLALAATFSHVGLWYGPKIWKQFKQAMRQQTDTEDDVHNRCMKAYRDIPEWMYLVFLAACIAFMCIVVTTTHFHMPLWAVFMGTGITMITLIPLGTIEAITGTRIYLNVLSQMFIGLLLPGKTIDVMAYKSLGTNSHMQALVLVSDLKLGHYMKIPPVYMVSCQLLGTLIGVITTSATTWGVMEGMKDLLGKGDWEATAYLTFYNAGAIWGAIGPHRFFGTGSPYESLLWGFVVGFFLPFLPWLGFRFYPSKYWKYINIPIIVYISGAGYFQNLIFTPFVVNFIFQFYLLRYVPDWWKKYNYVLAAAINGAVSFAVLAITVLRNLHIKAPIWSLNPDYENGYPQDYYCWEKSYG